MIELISTSPVVDDIQFVRLQRDIDHNDLHLSLVMEAGKTGLASTSPELLEASRDELADHLVRINARRFRIGVAAAFKDEVKEALTEALHEDGKRLLMRSSYDGGGWQTSARSYKVGWSWLNCPSIKTKVSRVRERIGPLLEKYREGGQGQMRQQVISDMNRIAVSAVEENNRVAQDLIEALYTKVSVNPAWLEEAMAEDAEFAAAIEGLNKAAASHREAIRKGEEALEKSVEAQKEVVRNKLFNTHKASLDGMALARAEQAMAGKVTVERVVFRKTL